MNLKKLKPLFFYLAIFFWPVYYLLADTKNSIIINLGLLFFVFPVLLIFLYDFRNPISIKFQNSQQYFFLFLVLFFFQKYTATSLSALSITSDLINVFVCVVFWYKTDSIIGSKKTNNALFISSGLILLFFIIPQYLPIFISSGKVINAFKNIELENLRFVKSTLEVSLWIGIFFSFLISRKLNLLKYFFIALITVLIFATGKRSLLIFCFLAILISYFRIIRKHFSSFGYFIPFIPVFFYFFSYALLTLFENNDFIYSLFVTSSAENFETGSGRILMWYDIILIFLYFDFSNLFSGINNFQFWRYFDDEIYYNLHNTYLQVFLESGYLLFFFIVTVIFKNIKEIGNDFKSYNFNKARSLLFLLIIILSNSEALLRVETSHSLVVIALLSLKKNTNME